MIPFSDITFAVINYTMYGSLLRFALKRYIIPYFVYEQADEQAQLLSLKGQRERTDAVSRRLAEQQQFFTDLFEKFARYIEHMNSRLRQAREDARAHVHARHTLYRQRYRKIYEQHLVSCQYRTLVPEVVARAEHKLKEYYRDQRHVDAYFERLMQSMREKN